MCKSSGVAITALLSLFFLLLLFILLLLLLIPVLLLRPRPSSSSSFFFFFLQLAFRGKSVLYFLTVQKCLSTFPLFGIVMVV